MTRFEGTPRALMLHVRCGNPGCAAWVTRALYARGRPKQYCSPACAGQAGRRRGQRPSKAFLAAHDVRRR